MNDSQPEASPSMFQAFLRGPVPVTVDDRRAGEATDDAPVSILPAPTWEWNRPSAMSQSKRHPPGADAAVFVR